LTDQLHDRFDRREGPASAAPRILHVVSSLDRGGIELWLLHLLRHIDRQRYPMDALVLADRRGPLEGDLQSVGCRAFYCAGHRKPWVLQRFMSDVLRRHGPYDVVHSHVHYFGGMVARLAAGQGVPIRIIHSRNDVRPGASQPGLLRQIYTRQMKKWIDRHATCRIAISDSAAEDLFGPAWQGNCTIVHSGRDLSPFAKEEDSYLVRRSLGLPGDALVVGHVGRFHARKNHALVIDIAAEVCRREPRARLLLVGDGPEEGAIRERACQAGIADRVMYAGASDDVPRLLKSAMDVFLFPSRHEGLGVAVVEAQAAGLPCVIAEHLPRDIDVIPRLVKRLPLSAAASEWGSAVLRAAHEPPIDPAEALAAVLATDFNIERSVGKIAMIYATARTQVDSVGIRSA
jgi:glycosyltransferase involved in cell wall biosynthesis